MNCTKRRGKRQKNLQTAFKFVIYIFNLSDYVRR